MTLVCATCNATPTADEYRYTVKYGTHYRHLTHAAGVPGREQGGKVRSCGPWVSAGATPEERAKTIAAWREKRGGAA